MRNGSRGKCRIPGTLMGHYPEEVKHKLTEAIKDLDDWVYYSYGRYDGEGPIKYGCKVYSDKEKTKVVFRAAKEEGKAWEVSYE